MKTSIEKRKPNGLLDYFALALTTFGVGYLPLMPGTFGSAVGVLIYLGVDKLVASIAEYYSMFSPQLVPFVPEFYTRMLPMRWTAWLYAGIALALLLFCLLGIWAAGRTTELFGDLDPSHAVVDEVIGQLIVFLFVPLGITWPFVLTGFLLFRLFDIWKPYPIDYLQVLPGGIGVCADDILAGVYAGVCLSIVYAISMSV